MTASLHAAFAEHQARAVLAEANARGATAIETRRMLRARLATLTLSRSCWYAAAVRAAGCLLLDLPDFRQRVLIDRGTRLRPRRKRNAHAA